MNQPIRIPETMNAVGIESGKGPAKALKLVTRPATKASRKDVGKAPQRLLGTWRLVAFTRNGQPHPVYGREPSGMIRYDASGNMAVQIMPERSSPQSDVAEPTPGTASAIPGYIAYFGGYRVDERAKTVVHDRIGNLTPGEPRTVVRHYAFLSDDRLALTLGEDATAQVLWQRVR